MPGRVDDVGRVGMPCIHEEPGTSSLRAVDLGLASSRLMESSSYVTVSEMGTLKHRPSQLPLQTPTLIESPEPTPVPDVAVVASDAMLAPDIFLGRPFGAL